MLNIKNIVCDVIGTMQLKSDLLVLKGMYAEMCCKVNWDTDKFNTEEQLKANKLLQQIVIIEEVLKMPKKKLN